MREIKFRAWDTACNCYVEKDWQIYLNGTVSVSDTWATKDIILEQYTGLKDKNGKEIFEGDIYKDIYKDKNEIGIIEFKIGCFWCVSDDDPFEISSMNVYLEIIGNIHENLELLKESTHDTNGSD